MIQRRACAAVVRVLAHRHEELGRQKHVVAAAVERFADDLFGDAAGVDVGRVDEVYAASSAAWMMRMESARRRCPKGRTSSLPGTVG